MAAGWIRAIRAVPWTDVVAAAPVVLGTARKMVAALQRKIRAEQAAAPEAVAPAVGGPQLHALHERIVELETDLVSATEVIRSLADQHAQVVATLEALRQKTRLLGWVSALLAAAMGGLALWIALR
ncbi:MAG: hypothetical protein JNK68_05280 [Betaproteobacteria bacterium]|nr:hypothetical protein [Betaproteobacteria bacterium]